MEEKTIKAWVATDADGTVWIYENKPVRKIDERFYPYSGEYWRIEQRFLPFPAPKWEEEPILVELTIKKVESDGSRS